MDFLGHPKALARLWATVMSDYEVVISNFLRSTGWTYSHFAEAAKKMEISLIFHCAVGKGKRRQELYEEVVHVILECAKDFWLSDVPDYNGSADPVVVKVEIQEEQNTEQTEPEETDGFMEFHAGTVKIDTQQKCDPMEFPAKIVKVETGERAGRSDTVEKCDPMEFQAKIVKAETGERAGPSTAFQIKTESNGGQSQLLDPFQKLSFIPTIAGQSKFPDKFMEEDEEPMDMEVALMEKMKAHLSTILDTVTVPDESLVTVPDESLQIQSTSESAPAPATTSTPRRKLTRGEYVMIKRQLGGFYLTYLLYFKQPYKGFHRILIDPEDYDAIKAFESKIQFLTPKIQEQYDFMMYRMKLNHGFEIVAFSDRFGLDHSTRTYLNAKKNEIVKLIQEDKDITDKLTQCQDVQSGQKKYQRYFDQKRIVLNESLHAVLKDACPTNIPLDFPDDSKAICQLVPELRSTEAVGQMVEAASNIKALGQQPLFTHTNLLGNESVDRIFIKEACKRMTRVQVKQEKGRAGKTKTKNPYVREGGIFGRKKDSEEGDKELRRKKERAQTSGNLWNYINDVDFNRGRPPPPPPPSTGEVPVRMLAIEAGPSQPGGSSTAEPEDEVSGAEADETFMNDHDQLILD